MDSVTLTTHPRFVLLEPRSVPPRVGESYQRICPTGRELENLLRSAFQSQLIAVDFETRGNDYSLPADDAHVIGVGLAWDRGSCYLDPSSLSATEWRLLDRIFLEHKGLLAHNVYFDGGWLRRDYGTHAGWYACTYGMYMQLASEGFEGQRWSLKDAIVDLLLWSNTNETDLDNWLISNGYKNQSHRPLKGEMWRAPSDILGKYCVLDAEATYLLFTEIFQPVLDKFPSVLAYHQQDFLPHVMIHIDQKMHGILTDRTHWQLYASELATAVTESETLFRQHDKIAPFVAEWEAAKLEEFLATEPARYRKVKERKEPAQFTKKKLLTTKEFNKLCSQYLLEYDAEGNILLYETSPE